MADVAIYRHKYTCYTAYAPNNQNITSGASCAVLIHLAMFCFRSSINRVLFSVLHIMLCYYCLQLLTMNAHNHL